MLHRHNGHNELKSQIKKKKFELFQTFSAVAKVIGYYLIIKLLNTTVKTSNKVHEEAQTQVFLIGTYL